MRMYSRPSTWGLFLLLLLLPWVSGCDQGSLKSPDVSEGLFQSYVAIGNSITAGFQSGGINENTQKESFAVLLAEQMNTPFNVPLLPTPGCPPPLSQAFPPTTIAPDVDCALRQQFASSTLNNVAVPAAAVVDVLSNTQPSSSPNALTSFILGGDTQIEAAKQANPTFVTAWIGNNDVLGAALAGDARLATAPDSFRTRYSTMLSELESIRSLEGGVFLGVADVTLIPHLSRGAAYRQANNAGALPSNFNLNNCSLANSGAAFVPFQHGAALLGVADAVASFGASVTLDCAQDRTVEETVRQSLSPNIASIALEEIPEDVKQISLLTPQETSVLTDRVTTFNQIIQNQLGDDYAFVNPNPLFQNNLDQIPEFPNLSGSEPFGPLFSLDGVHPSAAAHRLVANRIIEEINATYDTNLSAVSSSSQ